MSADDDSDSDPFNDFSLNKLAAKAQQAKKAAMAASSSPGSQASPSVKPSSTPTTSSSITKGTSSSLAEQASSKNKSGSNADNLSTVDKYKSIFSESSETDSEVNKKKSKANAAGSKASKKRVPSPSPPRLSPQKSKSSGAARLAAAAAAKKSAKSQKKPPPPTKKKTAGRARSASSESVSSKSCIDSENEAIKKPAPVTKTQKSANKKPASKSATTAQKKKQEQALAKQAELAKAAAAAERAAAAAAAAVAAAAAASSDSEMEVKAPRSTRRQTRGANVRKSKFITGKNYEESGSETENFTEAPTPTSPRKRINSSSMASSTKASTSTHDSKKEFKQLSNGEIAASLLPVRRDLDDLTPMEHRKCPIQGCDSSGHLNGKLDRHFTAEACPIYHNVTKKWCQNFRSELIKKNSKRNKASSAIAAKSPQGSPTSDQKKHYNHVKDERSKFRPENIPETEEIPDDRELNLEHFTSKWDLQLFREAQAAAAEDHENAYKGLPDTKQPKYIELGRHEMEVWYQSPYPEEYSTLPKLYICEFCLKYLKSATQLRRHAVKCVWNHPPGDEIYRKEPISVYEICGKRYKQYCQSLCLLAKFFLDHKTLYFDVEPFLFYVMTTADSSGCHVVGYFSKEKNSVHNYNVSCILTLPPYQRQGFGRLLIDFSYLLSRTEGKIGSPEKPLSDLGLMTYRAYWKDVLLEYICNFPEKELSIKAFCDEMGINPYDIVSTLQALGMIKYWKGHHIIIKQEDIINVYVEKSRNRPRGRQIYSSALKWKPYEPTARERKQAEQIKKNQEDKQKKR